MRFAIAGAGYIRVEVQDPTNGLGYNLSSVVLVIVILEAIWAQQEHFISIKINNVCIV